MLALGSCLAGVGLLAAGLLALLFRNPNAPGWTRPEIVALLACIPVTVATALGLGYVAFGVFGLLRGAGDFRELLVLLGVVIVLAVAWRGLRINQRLKDYAAATSGGFAPSPHPAPPPTPLVDETPCRLPGPAPASRRARLRRTPCAAILVLAAVAPAFRSDNPPRWTTNGWAAQLVTLAIVCTLALGLGYLGAGAIEATRLGLDYRDLGLLVGVLLITAVIWRSLKARARSSTPAADAAGPDPGRRACSCVAPRPS